MVEEPFWKISSPYGFISGHLILFHGLFVYPYASTWTSLVAQTVKRLSTMRETWVWSLGWEDPLKKEMAIHSSTIAWKIPWTEEPGRLQSMGSQRVGHDWATSLSCSCQYHSFDDYSFVVNFETRMYGFWKFYFCRLCRLFGPLEIPCEFEDYQSNSSKQVGRILIQNTLDL